MEIDDPSGEGVKKARFQHPHEACEHDQIWLCGGDGGDEPRLALALELGLERSGVDERGGDAETRAERQHRGIGAVGEQRHHACAAELASLLGGEDRLCI